MLIERFKQYIRENGLLQSGDRVLLAVSGGVDSMAMLSLFAEAGRSGGFACQYGNKTVAARVK